MSNLKSWSARVLAMVAIAVLLVPGIAQASPRGRAPDSGRSIDLQPAGAPVFNISAIDVVITLNRFGDHDLEGKMFVLDENIPAVRAQEARPLPDRVSIGLRDDPIQPLVVRANIGDTVVINFTNRLRSGRASIQIHGLQVAPGTSVGSNVGLNPDTTVAPGQSITYTWRVPDQRNAEGAYVFNSMGDDMRQQMAHGLFGVLNVELKGSIYLNPTTGRPQRSGWEAIIVDPGGKDFREDTIIYHEIGDESFRVAGRDGSPLPLNDALNEGAYRPASRALNYRFRAFPPPPGTGGANPEAHGCLPELWLLHVWRCHHSDASGIPGRPHQAAHRPCRLRAFPRGAPPRRRHPLAVRPVRHRAGRPVRRS